MQPMFICLGRDPRVALSHDLGRELGLGSPTHQPGLGIGLTLARRIAEWRGRELHTDAAQAPLPAG